MYGNVRGTHIVVTITAGPFLRQYLNGLYFSMILSMRFITLKDLILIVKLLLIGFYFCTFD